MPTQLLVSGEVEFNPREHTICGLCRSSFMLCQCEGLGYAENYILVRLPSPPYSATPSQLIKRWCSLVKMSPSMGVFNAYRWYDDNCQGLVASMQERAQLLNEMIEDYIANLPQDRTLPSLAKAVGGIALHNRPKAEQIQKVAAEARAAVQIFLSGDWSCITYIGSMLLQNAFQVSDPQKYSLNDAHLSVVFENGVGLLSTIMGRGFGNEGWHLAMECDRRPCGTSLPSATQRLSES